MKRIVSSILMACLLLLSIPITAYGAETDQEIIYLEDGSYLTITTYQTRRANVTSGSKTFTQTYNDKLLWEVTLNGTFSYTGSSAICTSASCDVSISDSSWVTISKNASRSGSSAKASATIGRREAGIIVERKPVSLKLTCSADGELS